MATRKQKHAAAVARRERFLEKVAQDGLAAQQASREQEAQRNKLFRIDAERVNRSIEKNLVEKIIDQAFEYGYLLRIVETREDAESVFAIKAAWEKFINGLEASPHRMIARAYYAKGYDPEMEISDALS
jgi:hypothetical protein